MATTSDWAVARDRDGVFRLDRTAEPVPCRVAYIKPVIDRTSNPSGWRLKPLVTLQGPRRKLWKTAAEAIASTKLMALAQAKPAVAKASGGETCDDAGGVS
jgi:hypothetical protein